MSQEKTPIARFMDEECEVTCKDHDSITARELYSACYDWCVRNGFKNTTTDSIARAIFIMSRESGSGFIRSCRVWHGAPRYVYFGIRLRNPKPSDWTINNLPDCHAVGGRVVKVDGYPFPGEVRSVFVTRAGAVRYVVEATGADYAGMLHIFSPRQLAPAPLEGKGDVVG